MTPRPVLILAESILDREAFAPGKPFVNFKTTRITGTRPRPLQRRACAAYSKQDAARCERLSKASRCCECFFLPSKLGAGPQREGTQRGRHTRGTKRGLAAGALRITGVQAGRSFKGVSGLREQERQQGRLKVDKGGSLPLSSPRHLPFGQLRHDLGPTHTHSGPDGRTSHEGQQSQAPEAVCCIRTPQGKAERMTLRSFPCAWSCVMGSAAETGQEDQTTSSSPLSLLPRSTTFLLSRPHFPVFHSSLLLPFSSSIISL